MRGRQAVSVALAAAVFVAAPGPAAARVLGRVASQGAASAPSGKIGLPALSSPLLSPRSGEAPALSGALPLPALPASAPALSENSAAPVRPAPLRSKLSAVSGERASVSPGRSPGIVRPGKRRRSGEVPLRSRLRSIADTASNLGATASDAPPSSLKRGADFTLPAASVRSAVAAGVEAHGRSLPSLLGRSRPANSADPARDAAPAPPSRELPSVRGQVVWGLWNLSAAAPYLWMGLDLLSGAGWTTYALVGYGVFNLMSGLSFLLLAKRIRSAKRAAERDGVDPESLLSANDLHQVGLHRRQSAKGRRWFAFVRQMIDHVAYFSVEAFGKISSGLDRIGVGRLLETPGEFFFGDRELRPLLRRYLTPMIALTAVSFVGIGIATLEAQLTGDLFNVATGEAASAMAVSISTSLGWALLPSLIAVVMGATVAYAVVQAVTMYFGGLLTARVAHHYRRAIYDRIWRQETDHLAREGGAALADRALVDPDHLQAMNKDVPMAVPYYIAYLFAGGGLLLATNLPIGAVVIAASIPLALFMRWAAKAYRKLGDDARGTELEIKNLGTESFDNIKKVRTHGTVSYERGRMQSVGDRQVAIENKMVMVNSKTEIVDAISTFFSDHFITMTGAILLAGAGAVGLPAIFASAPTYGEIIRLGMLAGLFIYGVSGLAENVQAFATAKGKSRRTVELMGREPADVERAPEAPRPVPAGALGASFENVVVEYADGTRGLDGATFSAEPGSIVAIMGDSGGGKTTAVDLLPLTRRAKSGTVRIGGIPIDRFDPSELRARISFLDQHDVFPGRTARELLSEWANRPVDDADLEAALRAARADFVLERGEGLDEVLTPETLSGGERRRFSLAGALLREAGLLILDEPTRGLDPEIAEEVRRSILDNVRTKGRTAMMITHDLGLAERADRIVVLSRGRVLEQGTPAELRANEEGWYGSFLKKALEREAREAEEKAEAQERERRAPLKEEVEDEEEAAPSKLTTAWRSIQTFVMGHKIVRPLLRKYYKPLITGMLFIALTAFFEGGASYALGWMLDAAFSGTGSGWPLVSTMLMATGGLTALFVLRTYLKLREWPLTGFSENGFVSDLRAFVFGRLMTKRMPFYGRVRSGKLAQWLEEGVENMSLINITYRIPLAKAVLTVVIASGLMAVVNWQVTVLMLPVLSAVSLLSAWLGGKAWALGEKITERRTEIVSSTKEVLSGIRHYKRLGRAGEERGVFDAHSNGLREMDEKAALIHTAAGVGGSSLSEIATKYGLLVVGALSVAGTMAWVGLTPGTIVTMTMLAALFQEEFQGLWETWIAYTQARGASDRVVRWIEDEADVDTSDLPPLAPLTGRMRMPNTTYRYAKDLPPAIEDVDIEIAAGETVLIAGPSGSGKSTALGALLGLLRAERGGTVVETERGFEPLAEANYESFLDQIAVVDQEPNLFSGSYRFNITYGLKRLPSDAEIAEALELAGVDFVSPDRIDEKIDGLSGGQKQRINLARAILRRPRVLFLDEPTAYLDPKRNADFWRTVARLKSGDTSLGTPTIVIVSHNIRDVADIADHAVTLDRGRVVDDGTPKDLLSRDTLFRRLWRADGPT
jgi:ABC-type multidrug transport system fused ATPase/permease subunit